MKEIKCISIRQPWSWLIVNGYKDIENRVWKYEPKYRGPLLIHTGQKPDPDMKYICDRVDAHFNITIPRKCNLGGLVGVVTLKDIVTDHDSVWFNGDCLGFVLSKPKLLHFTTMKGKLGLFNVQLSQLPVTLSEDIREYAK